MTPPVWRDRPFPDSLPARAAQGNCKIAAGVAPPWNARISSSSPALPESAAPVHPLGGLCMFRLNLGSSPRYCDGLSRRSFLALGVAGMGSVALPDLLRA